MTEQEKDKIRRAFRDAAEAVERLREKEYMDAVKETYAKVTPLLPRYFRWLAWNKEQKWKATRFQFEEETMCGDCKTCRNAYTDMASTNRCAANTCPTIGFTRCPHPDKRVERLPELKSCPFCAGRARWDDTLGLNGKDEKTIFVKHDERCPMFRCTNSNGESVHSARTVAFWNERHWE